MKKFLKNPRTGWYILSAGFVIILLLFIPMTKMISRLRIEEQKKVELWANAVSHKAAIVDKTEKFYGNVTQNEKVRLQQFIEAYKIIMSQPEDVDLSSPKLRFYTNIIMDNKSIPVIITDEFNNIVFSQNVNIDKNQSVLVGDLYKRFSQNPPYEYEVYGMKFRLYYTESVIYSDLRSVLNDVSDYVLTDITDNTVFVPVLITDSSQTKILAFGNITKDKVSPQNAAVTIEEMKNANTPIRISLPEGKYGYILYEKSATLTILKYYPLLYIVLLVLAGALFFKVYQTIKVSQQNSLWVGMSKETAHQLGTPISSLIAWIELLKMKPENSETCREMAKDVDRLNLIADRFSQIGSVPELKMHDIVEVIDNTVAYMTVRSPKKVVFTLDIPQDVKILIPMNKSLIEWTFENIIKNAVDAMEGNGNITIKLEDKQSHIHLDIQDTGKGMMKKQFKQVFQPGYTTKKRGWGLGLSLVRRIIEEYHNGRIYVKNSVVGKGTTFRIELPKDIKNGKRP
ncbi:MAG: ATP-binding protein [Bacteroidales bacterium]|nr:ATP-binding protein [Bacteroidales bacterium]